MAYKSFPYVIFCVLYGSKIINILVNDAKIRKLQIFPVHIFQMLELIAALDNSDFSFIYV